MSTSPQSSIIKLGEHLNYVNRPTSSQTVYKDESVYDFDIPESKRTRNCMETREERPERPASPPRKRTKSTHAAKSSQFDEQFKVSLLDDLPEEILESNEGVLAAEPKGESPAVSGNQQKGVQRPVTQFADLQQLDNGVQVPSKGWICSKCPKRDDLWMNLTDGTIGCSRRRYFDGSGGNHHAFEHYLETGYPLVVKLSSIMSHGADVYSYPEDQMVDDPKISEHLAHFGIHVEENKDDQTITLDDCVITLESDENLNLLSGPGYVGMENLGNSCYLNCVMQVLFSTSEFQETYYPPPDQLNLICPAAPDPSQEFDSQMVKLAYGLLSPYYSLQWTNDQPVQSNSIRPTSFKQLVGELLAGKGFPEFLTKKQQDAEEFFRHIMDLIEESHNKFKVLPDLSVGFKFRTEEKTTCMESKKINYAHSTNYVLSLPIALDKASDLVEVQDYLDKRKAEVYDLTLPDVLPRVKLTDCLKQFASEETINDFVSPVTNTRTQAKRQYRLETYPDYLMVQMQKFASNGGGQPKKIHCSLDVPLVLDLSFLRAKGPQPGEQLMADSIQPEPMPFEPLELNDNLVGELLDMGYSLEACEQAFRITRAEELNVALNWLNDHPNGLKKSSENRSKSVCGRKVRRITEMGIRRAHAIRGLQEHDELNEAVAWICEKQPELMAMEEQGEIKEAEFRDGREMYQLVAFITHNGESANSGHYVCYIWKDGRWVLYNDNMVVESENPPIDLAYMYLYQRIVH